MRAGGDRAGPLLPVGRNFRPGSPTACHAGFAPPLWPRAANARAAARAAGGVGGGRREGYPLSKPDRPRGATIVDVAQRAGVSRMTVSRVINDGASVRETTREAVQAAIRELSYAPNLAARNLVMAGELRIGVVYSNPSAAFMSDFLVGVFEEATNAGARLILARGENGHPPA